MTQFRTVKIALDYRDDVHVREVNARVMADLADIGTALQREGMSHRERTELAAQMIVHCACKADLTPLFTSVDQVLDEPQRLFERCLDAITKLNGLGEGDDSGN